MKDFVFGFEKDSIKDKVNSGSVMMPASSGGGVADTQPSIIFDKIIQCGGELTSGVHSKYKDSHPFERLLLEMNIKHRYTRPYRPQTNGKVERFWKTLKEDFLDDALYEDIDDLREELLGFLVYYNEHRPHTSLENLTPKEFIENEKNVTN